MSVAPSNAHARASQGGATEIGKSPSESRLTLGQIMDDHDTNLLGTVHGGEILKLVDSVAGVVAARHSEGPAVTAFMDEVAFLAPVRVGDVLHVDAVCTWAGRTSMEVSVTARADRWDSSGPQTTVATAHLVMVAVDDARRPRPVPPLVPQTEEEQRHYQQAEIRRRHRLTLREDLRGTQSAA
ncbi:acyl-CoA thioesterase [Pilimelia terevasa]|uniref:Acyl-CoA thioesterase n=1 Tax=Pilimelia terevasa TaxID=53372 RepID=A0A8J3FH43_9ACTN|nr:hotdog domain-containing protein [Pilimelia terevasa]GGK12700.1 acyl-CoA thioesterase [Pilimelia terevasa]